MLPKNHWDALEVDLLRIGIRLEDVPSRVGWRAVWQLYRHANRSDAVFAVAAPVANAWSTNEHLQAAMVDILRMLLWAKTRDGQKNRKRPKPLARPGDVPPETKFGKPVKLSEFKNWLAAAHAADRIGASNLTMDEVMR